MEKLISSLSQIERAVIPHLNKSIEEIMIKTSLDKTTVIRALTFLENKEIVKLHQKVNKIADFVTMIKSFAIMVSTHGAYDVGLHIANSSGILKDLYNLIDVDYDFQQCIDFILNFQVLFFLFFFYLIIQFFYLI